MLPLAVELVALFTSLGILVEADWISRDDSEYLSEEDAGAWRICGEAAMGGRPDLLVRMLMVPFTVDSLRSDCTEDRFFREPSTEVLGLSGCRSRFSSRFGDSCSGADTLRGGSAEMERVLPRLRPVHPELTAFSCFTSIFSSV